MGRALQEGHLPGRVRSVLRSLANLVRPEPSRPRPSFEDRWQVAESLSPEQQANFVIAEIRTLAERVRKGGIPHRQDVIFYGYSFGMGGRGKPAPRIDIGNIPKDSLPPEIRTALLTQLDAQRTHPELWGGQPSLGLSFYDKPGLTGGWPRIELTVATVNSADGSIRKDKYRQGITVMANPYALLFDEQPLRTAVITKDWDWSPTYLSREFDELKRYTEVTPPFQVIKAVVRFAEGVVQARPPQLATAAA